MKWEFKLTQLIIKSLIGLLSKKLSTKQKDLMKQVSYPTDIFPHDSSPEPVKSYQMNAQKSSHSECHFPQDYDFETDWRSTRTKQWRHTLPIKPEYNSRDTLSQSRDRQQASCNLYTDLFQAYHLHWKEGTCYSLAIVRAHAHLGGYNTIPSLLMARWGKNSLWDV